jgi:hypothetical protein
MKRKVVQFCSLVALLIGLTVSAQGQIGARYRAYIPFDFNLGNKTFPAGDYIFELTNPASNQNALTIREVNSREAKIIQVIQKEAKAKSEISKLVFNRFDEQYFLAEMITPTLAAEFRKLKIEQRLNKTKKSVREIVALSR